MRVCCLVCFGHHFHPLKPLKELRARLHPLGKTTPDGAANTGAFEGMRWTGLRRNAWRPCLRFRSDSRISTSKFPKAEERLGKLRKSTFKSMARSSAYG